jgi:phosphonatase-like hydrolase
MNLALVVFDMAGTTVDDGESVNRCLREAIAAAGLDVARDAVNAHMGRPKPEAIRALVAGTPCESAVEDIYADFARRMKDCYARDPSLGEVPGSRRLFEQLRGARIRVALNTGFSRDIADTLLRRLGWHENIIDATITSDEVARGRPFPDMIEHLRARFQIADPRLVAKVGDTPADLDEGHNAGCGLVIGVTWGTHTREQLSGPPHTHLVDTIDELTALLGVSGLPAQP